mmetsp:Transcript_12558/g.28652  ORF Transcript_12558/g.28652 Transcript_12558/m.28652 type:complete len:212 (+) Transcript_12558:680-1315(+)
MGLKLKGEHPSDQEPLGGVKNATERRSLERPRDQSPQHSRALVLPRRVLPARRRVQQIMFEDGSRCDCSSACSHVGTCCDDWDELCKVHFGPRTDAAIPCPVPSEPPIASSSGDGSPIRLTFLSHASYPLKLYLLGTTSPALEEIDMGTLFAEGQSLTFDSSDNHAWVVRSFGGVTIMELNSFAKRPQRLTIDIYECDLATAARRLHYGWK